MKVLKTGSWLKPWSIEVECTNQDCGALLLVEEGDVKATSNSYNFHVKCVVCNQDITLKSERISSRVRKEVEKTREWTRSNTTDEL